MSENCKRDDVGPVRSPGGDVSQSDAASGDAACKPLPVTIYRLPSHGGPGDPPPRRLRRLHRVWPDHDGNISYLLAACVDGRAHVLDNELTFERLVSFLLDSPARYRWFGRRFVLMPDHIHVIARMGYEPVRLGQWIKALKAVVGGLERRDPPQLTAGPDVVVGRVPSRGANGGPVPPLGGHPHRFTRIKRAWRWQDGFHDHKLRTPEGEQRKWEYVCLNPVRAGLVKRPEDWPYGGEIFYDEAGGPRLVRGTPPLLETGILIEDNGGMAPVGGNRTTT